MESAREIAQRDMVQANYNNGITLALPANILFDVEEFFSHYKDPMIDRYAEHQSYILKRDKKLINKIKPLR